MRKTKIVCTIGPASDSVEMLEKLIKAGMNTARLNFSHGDHKEKLEKIRNIRTANSNLGTYVAIMADTKGPEIRIGNMGEAGVEFATGDEVIATKENVVGTKERFQICCPELFDDIKVGNVILFDDGKLSMEIIEILENGDFKLRCRNSGKLITKKSANVPNVKLSMPFISKQDDDDIRFACRNKLDFIAASFVRRADDILQIRKILEEENNKTIEIIAKIENQEGYDNLEEILQVADAVMVARGDLGVEVDFSMVPIYQKKMIKMANLFGKPVITATHMLESMSGNPRSTRAETSDVANAVLDGSDAVMLSGETASGLYPEEAVKTMAEIAEKAEDMLDYHSYVNKSTYMTHRTKNEAIGIAVSETCLTLDNVSCVIAFTETGGTPKRIARFRPKAPLIAATNSQVSARKMGIYWGVYPVLNQNITESDFYDITANEIADQLGFEKGSIMIITCGYHAGHGLTNTMRLHDVK